MTSADAQAFKRACSCFGLGRYFYDFPAIWVDLDQNRQPVRAPMLSAWALPENWRKGMRPSGRNGNGKRRRRIPSGASERSKQRQQWTSTHSPNFPHKWQRSNGQSQTEKANGSSAAAQADDLDERILCMEKAVGTTFYRSILREYGRVNQPKLIRDASHQAESSPDAGVGCARDSIVWKPSQSGSIRRRLRHCWLSSKPLLSARFRTSRPCNTLCLVSKNSPAPINTTQHNHCLLYQLEQTEPLLLKDSHLSKGMSDGTSTS